MLMRFVLPALALGLAVPAVAETVTVSVPYGDLDLTKPTGRQTLDDRLDRAARKGCGGVVTARVLSEIQAYRSCVDQARADYEEQVQIALSTANARRVATLADKLSLLVSF